MVRLPDPAFPDTVTATTGSLLGLLLQLDLTPGQRLDVRAGVLATARIDSIIGAHRNLRATCAHRAARLVCFEYEDETGALVAGGAYWTE